MMEQMIALVVCAHSQGVSMVRMRVMLVQAGMDDEEASLLFDIVALEVRRDRVGMVRAQGGVPAP